MKSGTDRDKPCFIDPGELSGLCRIGGICSIRADRLLACDDRSDAGAGGPAHLSRRCLHTIAAQQGVGAVAPRPAHSIRDAPLLFSVSRPLRGLAAEPSGKCAALHGFSVRWSDAVAGNTYSAINGRVERQVRGGHDRCSQDAIPCRRRGDHGIRYLARNGRHTGWRTSPMRRGADLLRHVARRSLQQSNGLAWYRDAFARSGTYRFRTFSAAGRRSTHGNCRSTISDLALPGWAKPVAIGSP